MRTSYRGAMAAARTSVMSQETNLMPHENCFPLQIPLTQLLSWPTSRWVLFSAFLLSLKIFSFCPTPLMLWSCSGVWKWLLLTPLHKWPHFSKWYLYFFPYCVDRLECTWIIKGKQVQNTHPPVQFHLGVERQYSKYHEKLKTKL